MYIKENRNHTIGLKKILDNFKRYYWIVIASFLLGALSVILLSYKESQTLPQVTTQSYLRLYWDDSVSSEEEWEIKLESDVQGNTYVQMLLAEYKSYMNTNKFRRELERNYEQKFKSNKHLALDTLKMESTRYVVKFEIIGDTQDENVFLLQYVNEQFLEFVKETTYLTGEVIDSPEKETSTIVEAPSFGITTLFNIKNIFIVFLCAMLGLAIVLVFAIVDDKIRTRAEMKELYNIPYMGTVYADTYGEDIERIGGIVKYYRRKQPKGAFVVIGATNSPMFGEVKRLFVEKVQGENILFADSLTMVDSFLMSDKDIDNILVLVNIGQDKIKDIDYIVALCEKMDIDVLGYVLCEKLK